MVVVPSDTKTTNKIFKQLPQEIYGTDTYVHYNSDKDTRPWLCINKVDVDTPTKDIKQLITNIKTDFTNKNITIEGLHRKQKGNLKTTLLLFKTTDEEARNKLINTKIPHNNKILTIRTYIDKGNIRCTKCQQLGHTKHTCKNTQTCVRCGQTSCPPQQCKNPNIRQCVNCRGQDAASYKNCPELKRQQQFTFEKRKTQSYADVVTKQQQQYNIKEIEIDKAIQTQQQNNNQLQQTIEQQNTQIQTQNNEIDKLKELLQEQTNKHQIAINTIINNTQTEITKLTEFCKLNLTTIAENRNDISIILRKTIAEVVYDNINNRSNPTKRDIDKQTKQTYDKIRKDYELTKTKRTNNEYSSMDTTQSPINDESKSVKTPTKVNNNKQNV